ncbi:hypothetical protein SO802_000844 [Lithocarpus litseifolius]|uniref:Uncharacterized protein n=1 Tax=Lithocarpus litseifolius TaxID=425828 RepID=A0AAW2DWP0_9ROSI
MACLVDCNKHCRFKTEKSSLWARVLSHKYRVQRSRSINLLNTSSCSSTWVGIKKGEAIVSKGAKWVAGKDSGLSLWFDKWLDMGTLGSDISSPLTRGEEEVRLKDISSFLGWKWEGISFSFPKEILMKIKATPIPYSKLREDRLSWSSSPSGEFQLKDAYRIANAKQNKSVNQPFSGAWVWKIPVFQKLSASFGSVVIRAYLCMHSSPKEQCDVSKIDWAILFPIAVWVLWLHRNSTIFVKAIKHKDLKAETLAKAAEMAYLGITEKHNQT